MAKKIKAVAPLAIDGSSVPQEAPEPVPAPSNPIAELVQGIKVRQALVAKSPEEFPVRNRPGLVSAQSEAREELIAAEREYAHYFKQVAVAAVLLSSKKENVQKFLDLAKTVSSQQPVVLECDALYQRIAKAAAPGLSDHRQFGAGQMGLVIQELAAIGKELSFSELASPRWEYDVLVPTQQDLVEVIRRAIRNSADGDFLNRSYIRMAAYRQALEQGHSERIVPVLISNATPEEVPFLMKSFGAAVALDLDEMTKGGHELNEEDIKASFSAMVTVLKAADARGVVQ